MASKQLQHKLKLPALLSTLPLSASGSSSSSFTRPILLRPTSWPKDSFYLLTRHSLKFPLKSAPTARAKPPAVAPKHFEASSSSSSSGAGGVTAGEVGKGEIRAAGKAWGVKFWNGRPITPASPRIPDPLIPHSLVEQWESHDPSSLSQSTQEAIAGSRELVKRQYEGRKEVLAQIREGKRVKLAERVALASA